MKKRFFVLVLKCRKFQRYTRISINAAAMRTLLVCVSGHFLQPQGGQRKSAFLFV